MPPKGKRKKTKRDKKVEQPHKKQRSKALYDAVSKTITGNKWITDSGIKMRRCSCYMPSEENNEICQCGYQRKDHSKIALNREKQEGKGSETKLKWDFSQHTESEKTSAIGNVEFADDSQLKTIERKFVRVDIQTDITTMLKMIKRWGMEIPNLLISVTGSTKDVRMNTRLKETFQKGLMKAVHSIGAWIITGGINAGVMKHVGEAVRIYRNSKSVVAIGIAPWGVIQNREELEGQRETSEPATYHHKGDPNKNESFLEPNHTHFILVDDGTLHRFEIEIPFRAQLEKAISTIKTDKGDDALPVFIIVLVLGGESGTFETVKNALEKDTPVVIVKESGGAADILASVIRYMATLGDDDKDSHGQENNRTENLMNPTLETDIREKMKTFGFADQDIDTNVQRIKDCLAKSDLIHVFELDGVDHTLDAIVLKALLKANKNLFKNRIKTDKTKMTFSLDYLMMHALQSDSADFVKLLLDNGIKLEMFLTKERLETLYNNVSSETIFKDLWLKKKEEVSFKRIFKNLCCRKKEEMKIELKDVTQFVQDLLGDNYLQHYIKEDHHVNTVQTKNPDVNEVHTEHNQGVNGVQQKDEGVNEVQKRNQDVDQVCTKYQDVNEVQNRDPDINEVQNKDSYVNAVEKKDKVVNEVQKKDKGGEDQKMKQEFENPCLDLFIWSVLNNEQEKAKLFWRYGEDKMAAALVAHALLSVMSRQTDNRELREDCENSGSEFMKLAIKIAKKCYKKDDKKTQHLVIREMKQWSNTTCIEIAVNAHDKGFISQHVCLDLFDEIWMGGLKPENSVKSLLLCMTVPLLIPFVARFNEKEDGHIYLSKDENRCDGQDAMCCLSSERSKVIPHSEDQAGGKSDLTVREKFGTFYKAPIIIFMHNFISFIAFLFLYSFVLISKMDLDISGAEIVLIVWVAFFFFGEIVQVLRRPASCICKQFQLYKEDGWNVLDMFTILLFITGMLAFRTNSHPIVIEIARVILGIDLVLFFMRILHICHAHRQIGPKLVMIMNMVWDVGSLAAIIGVFILAYAVSSYAILYPNTELTIDIVIDIIKRPYWNIYGELNLEKIEGLEDCSKNEALYGNGTLPRCPTKAGQYVVPVMMGIYVFMTNILLISLLIATFSYSIENIQQHTDLHCSVHRYNLICEYYTRPCLPHPLALLCYLLQIPRILICAKYSGRNPFKEIFSPRYEKQLCEFEKAFADKVLQKMEQNHPESINTIAKRLEQLGSKLNELQQTVTTKLDKPRHSRNIRTVAEPRSTNLETKVEEMAKQLNSIYNVLQSFKSLTQGTKRGAKQTIPGETDVEEEC